MPTCALPPPQKGENDTGIDPRGHVRRQNLYSISALWGQDLANIPCARHQKPSIPCGADVRDPLGPRGRRVAAAEPATPMVEESRAGLFAKLMSIADATWGETIPEVFQDPMGPDDPRKSGTPSEHRVGPGP